MKKLRTLFVVPLLMTGLSTQVQAADIRPVFAVGYDVGGDTLATASFTNGSTKNIKAGDGFVISGGIYAPITNDMGIQATIGYKFDSITAKNGSIDFTRIPIDALAFKHFGQKHSVAAGLTYHASPTYKSSFSPNVSFDGALGFIAEYDFSFKSNTQTGSKIGIRYTNISYDVSATKQNFNGSAIGIILYVY